MESPPTAASLADAGRLPDLLTIEQAADHLQMSVGSIRTYIKQGKLKAFRVAGMRKVLIPRDELLKLLEPAREEDLSARQSG